VVLAASGTTATPVAVVPPSAVPADGTPPEGNGEPPALASPLTYGPGRPRPVVGVLTALLTGLVVAAVTRPLIGLAVGVAVLSGVIFARSRWLLTGAAVGLLVAAGAVVVVDQATHPAQPGGTWAPTFSTAALLAWAAVGFLAGDATVELTRRFAAHRRPNDPAAFEPEPEPEGDPEAEPKPAPDAPASGDVAGSGEEP